MHNTLILICRVCETPAVWRGSSQLNVVYVSASLYGVKLVFDIDRNGDVVYVRVFGLGAYRIRMPQLSWVRFSFAIMHWTVIGYWMVVYRSWINVYWRFGCAYLRTRISQLFARRSFGEKRNITACVASEFMIYWYEFNMMNVKPYSPCGSYSYVYNPIVNASRLKCHTQLYFPLLYMARNKIARKMFSMLYVESVEVYTYYDYPHTIVSEWIRD